MTKSEQKERDQAARLSDSRSVMVDCIDHWTTGKSDWLTPVPGLMFFRREAVMPPSICLAEPSIVMVVQGVKQMIVGGENYPYDVNHFLVTSLDIPANSQVIEASPLQPCLGLGIQIDLKIIAELISQGHIPSPLEPADDKGTAIGIGTLTPELVGAVRRLLNLLDEPSAIPILAPLLMKEIHYRLLQSDQAPRLSQIVAIGGQGHRIAKAIDWLKSNYKGVMRIEELAENVQMSSSSFHHYFRKLTAMSPLQYQKWLRLCEARRLMLNENLDSASAAFEVGYESPSQFSREYSRLFGLPPRRDISKLRAATSALSKE